MGQMLSKRVFTLILFLLCTVIVNAQDLPKDIKAVRTERAPKIDGKLSKFQGLLIIFLLIKFIRSAK